MHHVRADTGDDDEDQQNCARYGPWAPFEDFGERKAFPLYSKFATNTMRGRTVKIRIQTAPRKCDPTICVNADKDEKSLTRTAAPVATMSMESTPQPFGLRGTYERVFTGPKENLFTFKAGETIVFSDNGSVLHG
eukprot:6449093-Prymnesium_polylepis.1